MTFKFCLEFIVKFSKAFNIWVLGASFMSNMPEAGEDYRPSMSPNVALSFAERSRLQPRRCARRTRS